MKQIKVHIKLEGGKELTARNAHRIRARSLVATDRSGNRLDKDGRSPVSMFRVNPPYFQTWAIHQNGRGYCWQEVTSGSGICGYAPTVRELVLKTVAFGLFGTRDNIVVEIIP